MTDRELGIGLIGCGGIGVLRAAAVREAEGMRLAAVSDLDRKRAEAVAAGDAAVADDWRSLLARDDVDAVIVSTPPSIHAEMCVAAAEAGKHVLCEKPLARTSGECQAIVDATRAAGVEAATGFNYRFYPSVVKARELLDSGIIGELDHVRSYSGYSATDHSQEWLHDPDVMGGGALRDNGIHLLDLTCYFLGGDVVEAEGMASGRVWGFDGCEDNGFLLLRNRDGRIATVQASWTEWKGYRFALELYGSRGVISVSCFPMITRVTWSEERGGKTRSRRWLFPLVHLNEKLRSYRWVVTRSFVEELEAFGARIRGRDGGALAGIDAGARTIELAESAQAGPPAPAGSPGAGAASSGAGGGR